MKNVEFNKLYRLKAAEYGITVEELRNIVESPFLFVAEVMKSGDREKLEFKKVRVPFWGLFYVPDWVIERERAKLKGKGGGDEVIQDE